MRIARNLPNTITCLNLLSGTIAVIVGIEGNFLLSVYLVLLASLFDFMDGFAARLLKAYSPMGKELDSLADLVSFGFAPAILLYKEYNLTQGVSVLTFMPLLIIIASALRLAKFNIDTQQSENFIGMPTPTNAIIICMLIHFSLNNQFLGSITGSIWFIPVFSIVMSALLISKIPMFSLKFKSLKWEGNEKRISIIIIAIILFVISIFFGITWSASLLATFVIYLLINVIEFSIKFFALKR
jgi:CDP-diacylglycerol--serine O-phosphatidyltransferase